MRNGSRRLLRADTLICFLLIAVVVIYKASLNYNISLVGREVAELQLELLEIFIHDIRLNTRRFIYYCVFYVGDEYIIAVCKRKVALIYNKRKHAPVYEV